MNRDTEGTVGMHICATPAALAPAPAAMAATVGAGAVAGAMLRKNGGGPVRVEVAGTGVAAAAATPSPSSYYIYICIFFKIFKILFHGPVNKFDRYPCDIAEIAVWYVPTPVRGTVLVGTCYDTWKIYI